MWDTLYYGNSLRDWCISFAIIVGALLVNKLISLINRRLIRRFTARNRTASTTSYPSPSSHPCCSASCSAPYGSRSAAYSSERSFTTSFAWLAR